jgi:hypothetical protein
VKPVADSVPNRSQIPYPTGRRFRTYRSQIPYHLAILSISLSSSLFRESFSVSLKDMSIGGRIRGGLA